LRRAGSRQLEPKRPSQRRTSSLIFLASINATIF